MGKDKGNGTRCVGLLGVLLLVLVLLAVPRAGHTAAASCYNPLQIRQTKLKDHTLFRHDEYYYLASINIPLPEDQHEATKERSFAYARSRDLCKWQVLDPILGVGEPGEPDEFRIWAPHVYVEDGTYYMYYTGVNRAYAQTTMLAVSTDPADPGSWERRGSVFTPTHNAVMYPGEHAWSDNRDPMVLRDGNRYYMYYTAHDGRQGVIGVAIADTPAGVWRDAGPMYAGEPGMGMLESPFVVAHDGYFHLYFNVSGGDPALRGQWRLVSFTPYGPWERPQQQGIGWAYDFLRRDDGTWLASYVYGNGYGVAFSPIAWDTTTRPATPDLARVARVYLPLVVQQ